jgi:hypothetical protein
LLGNVVTLTQATKTIWKENIEVYTRNLETNIYDSSVLDARGGHDGVEHHSEVLLLVALGGAQYHQPVLDRSTVEVVQ